MLTIPHLDEAGRHRVVAAALNFTEGTPLAPKRYERELLACYATGTLTINEVIALLETSIYHVLYRSRATPAATEADLQTLLHQSRTYNAQWQLTGLLLYSDGGFVQLVEGPETAVQHLYTRIQQDSRHTEVITLSDGPGPQRWFADWHMAFGHVDALEMHQLVRAVEKQVLPLVPLVDPHLQTLFHAFGLPAPSIS